MDSENINGRVSQIWGQPPQQNNGLEEPSKALSNTKTDRKNQPNNKDPRRGSQLGEFISQRYQDNQLASASTSATSGIGRVGSSIPLNKQHVGFVGQSGLIQQQYWVIQSNEDNSEQQSNQNTPYKIFCPQKILTTTKRGKGKQSARQIGTISSQNNGQKYQQLGSTQTITDWKNHEQSEIISHKQKNARGQIKNFINGQLSQYPNQTQYGGFNYTPPGRQLLFQEQQRQNQQQQNQKTTEIISKKQSQHSIDTRLESFKYNQNGTQQITTGGQISSNLSSGTVLKSNIRLQPLGERSKPILEQLQLTQFDHELLQQQQHYAQL